VSFLAWELRPSALDDMGLVEALSSFVLEWSRHHNIPADFHAAQFEEGQVNSEMATHLYRITQESLNNIAKHAGATVVTVLLEKRDDEIILIIEDNGRGFDWAKMLAPKRNGRGLGLSGMRERAHLISGAFEIESSETGTTIYTRVPLAGTAQKAQGNGGPG
jgi:signal transduction histidine kinase